MENKYSLLIYPKAEQDMENIFEYISLEFSNPIAAINLIEKFYNSLEKVRYFPLSYSLTLSIAVKDKSLRKLCIENYIIFYKINEVRKQIEVVRVLYGMSKWEGIL